MDSFDMRLTGVFGIDQDIVQIYNNKDIKLLSKDLIDVALKGGRSIIKSEKHNLIFKMAVSGPKSCFPFIAFTDSYPIVRISQI